MKVLAFDLGGHNLRGAVVDAEGVVLDRRNARTVEGRDPLAVVAQISGMVEELASGQGGPEALAGAGLGIPGFMDVDTGFVYHSPNFPGWTQFNLTAELKKSIAIPFVLENDANCAALGEWWRGAGRGTRYAVGLTLGTGVGGGIVIDGTLVRGKHGTGGEVGHTVVKVDGPPCGCGGRGCLEAMISGDHILQRTGRAADDWEKRAGAGDPEALKIFDEVGMYLGVALSSLCQIFDPEVIALGGKISRAFNFFHPRLRAELDSRLIRHPAKSVRVVQAELGDDAGLLGAALTALRRAGHAHRDKG